MSSVAWPELDLGYRQWRYSENYRHQRFLVFIAIGDMAASMHEPMKQILSVPAQVGVVLRAARKSAQLSQKQLAAKVGLSQNRVSELETDSASMRVDQLLAVLSALGLELQLQTRGGSSTAGGADGAGPSEGSKLEW